MDPLEAISESATKAAMDASRLVSDPDESKSVAITVAIERTIALLVLQFAEPEPAPESDAAEEGRYGVKSTQDGYKLTPPK